MSATDLETADDLLRELARTPKARLFEGTERYRVRRCIGEGAFGVVYEIEDLKYGRRLALKTLKRRAGASSANIQHLKIEFRSAADIVHPNLVGLHELTASDRHCFFTMDLVQGCDGKQTGGPSSSSACSSFRSSEQRRSARTR